MNNDSNKKSIVLDLKNFPKIKKGRVEHCRDKSAQLMITSIVISHTHAPLQLCIVASSL